MNACDNNQRISDESILQEGRNVLSIERDAIEAIDQRSANLSLMP